jgi:hypothetical protein
MLLRFILIQTERARIDNMRRKLENTPVFSKDWISIEGRMFDAANILAGLEKSSISINHILEH